ncbi:MAG: pantetheine-phosphate adenylyltransferase [Planctomycetota bacterium]|nr:pantetheine-phosphate adenylyltransferase [Planctomycetota bacterium]
MAKAKRALRRAVYGGSFDPLTMGHMYMIREGARLFDELIVAIGINPAKKYTFPLEERLEHLRECTRGIGQVTVGRFENRFLVDYARETGAQYILRGVRNAGDYEYERTMRQVNGDIDESITTVLLMPPRELAELSSSFVKGLAGPAGWQRVVRKYLPPPVYASFLRVYGRAPSKRR